MDGHRLPTICYLLNTTHSSWLPDGVVFFRVYQACRLILCVTFAFRLRTLQVLREFERDFLRPPINNSRPVQTCPSWGSHVLLINNNKTENLVTGFVHNSHEDFVVGAFTNIGIKGINIFLQLIMRSSACVLLCFVNSVVLNVSILLQH